LFDGMEPENDSCSDPQCYAAKIEAHIRQTIAAKPKLVQISTAYGVQKEGSSAVPRNRYVEIRQEKPTRKGQESWPEYKTCKFTSEAIVTEGSEKGEIRRVCANPECPVHHARRSKPATDATIKAEEEKRRREEAIAQVTGLRVLSAITEAVPVRLMKRDLLFIVERLSAVLDERRLAIFLSLHSLGKPNAAPDAPAKMLSAFFRKVDESTLGRLLVELAVLQAATAPNESSKALREAAEFYKVDVAAITTKVKQEFLAKDKAGAARRRSDRKSAAKRMKKASAA
jgi:ParB family transcriptional regulator, chromosome partitioning protein